MITKIFLTVLSLIVAWILIGGLDITYFGPTEEEPAMFWIIFEPVSSSFGLLIVGFFIGLLLNLSNTQKS